jgi:2'-5' RNA ligase
MVRDDATQVEMDEHMTLRALGELDKQGTSESYFSAAAAQSPHKVSLSTLNESFQNVKVDR